MGRVRSFTERLTQGTGLRLALSRTEVEAILGKPDSGAQNRIAYCREFRRRATKKEFEAFHREGPQLSDQRAHALYDFFREVIHLEGRFSEQGLTYFFVSSELQLPSA